MVRNKFKLRRFLIGCQHVEYNKVYASTKFAKIYYKASVHWVRLCDLPCALKPNFLSQS